MLIAAMRSFVYGLAFMAYHILNSALGLVSKVTHLTPFDQSELSILGIPPTASPKVRPGRHPWVNRPSVSRR
jgi:hypothetical protein